MDHSAGSCAIVADPQSGSGSALAPYDGVLLVSFGGPERTEDVMPFMHRVTGGRVPEERLRAAAEVAGQRAVRGPAVVVVLDDVRSAVKPAGVSPELLVVHQQDIQAVVNALWAGGAEAMTIQGQRVTSRTGVKCVGNSVVLHGVPYAPPYEIAAIGDAGRLERALAESQPVRVYRQYVDAYGLGYAQRREAERTMPAYRGSLEITAKRVG